MVDVVLWAAETGRLHPAGLGPLSVGVWMHLGQASAHQPISASQSWVFLRFNNAFSIFSVTFIKIMIFQLHPRIKSEPAEVGMVRNRNPGQLLWFFLGSQTPNASHPHVPQS